MTTDHLPVRPGTRRPRATVLASGLVAGVVGALVLSVAGTASAASRVVRDASGDVASVQIIDDSDGPAGPTPDPRRRRGDLVSVRTTYSDHAVTIAARMRSLPRYGMVAAEIKSPIHKSRWGVFATITKGTASASLFSSLDDEVAVRCDGITARVRRGAGTLVLTVPAACLGTPRWVRTSLITAGVHQPSPAETAWPNAYQDFAAFYDVAGMDGMSKDFYESDSLQLPLGPRVRRG